MGKRPSQDDGNATQVHCTPPKAQMSGKPKTQTLDWLNAPPNACCFCWCCCCSCSCLTVRSGKEEKIQATVADEQEDAEPEQKLELTLEEVQTWSESFEKLIKSPAGRAHFQQFLKFEFSEENMLFWLACEELKKETNRTTVEQKVSLDSQAREQISSKMQDPSSCTFDEAQLQIHTLMQRDSYPRYINSSTYTDLIKSFQQPDQS
ncbi:Regulator of G-protein signaling 20 [Triplophysa tibetana]|uniref:Regulator of G-protein signaling 20 n=1 Tax=Triplophysa tibetana TaxID=1572043 RepID=A0A5A9PS90_9TELE|nr:Regulator of G-protein signaling 20 [Triplophysa tibetana]